MSHILNFEDFLNEAVDPKLKGFNKTYAAICIENPAKNFLYLLRRICSPSISELKQYRVLRYAITNVCDL